MVMIKYGNGSEITIILSAFVYRLQNQS